MAEGRAAGASGGRVGCAEGEDGRHRPPFAALDLRDAVDGLPPGSR